MVETRYGKTVSRYRERAAAITADMPLLFALPLRDQKQIKRISWRGGVRVAKWSGKKEN